jgi:hypothetical protein
MQCWLSFVHNQFVTEQRTLFNCLWQLTVITFLCLVSKQHRLKDKARVLTFLFKWR